MVLEIVFGAFLLILVILLCFFLKSLQILLFTDWGYTSEDNFYENEKSYELNDETKTISEDVTKLYKHNSVNKEERNENENCMYSLGSDNNINNENNENNEYNENNEIRNESDNDSDLYEEIRYDITETFARRTFQYSEVCTETEDEIITETNIEAVVEMCSLQSSYVIRRPLAASSQNLTDYDTIYEQYESIEEIISNCPYYDEYEISDDGISEGEVIYESEISDDDISEEEVVYESEVSDEDITESEVYESELNSNTVAESQSSLPRIENVQQPLLQPKIKKFRNMRKFFSRCWCLRKNRDD